MYRLLKWDQLSWEVYSLVGLPWWLDSNNAIHLQTKNPCCLHHGSALQFLKTGQDHLQCRHGTLAHRSSRSSTVLLSNPRILLEAPLQLVLHSRLTEGYATDIYMLVHGSHACAHKTAIRTDQKALNIPWRTLQLVAARMFYWLLNCSAKVTPQKKGQNLSSVLSITCTTSNNAKSQCISRTEAKVFDDFPSPLWNC